MTVRFKTEGTAELQVDYVGTLVDSAGSGFPDEVERLDLAMPVGEAGVHGSPLNLNPTLADTSGDGLRDSEVVDIEWEYSERDSGEWVLEAEVTDADAHPARLDTAGNGLTDYEELEVWGTDPLLADTSGDGFIDSVDPHPNEYSPPPEVRLFSQNYKDGILVAVDDKSKIESVEGNPYYDPPYADSKWDPDEASTYDLDEELNSIEEWLYENIGLMREEDDYSIMFDTHWGFGPEKYYVNVTDEYDNEVSFLVDVDSGGSEIAKAGVVVGGTASVPVDGPTAPVSAIAGLLALAGSGALFLASEQGYFGTSAEVEEISVEDMYKTHEQTWDAPGGSEIALPSGAIHEQSYYTGHVRGYGWEYIKETTSLTQGAIGHAIENPDEVIYEGGEVRYIIGEGLSESEKIILSIIGGAVIAADGFDRPVEHESSESNCHTEDFTVETDNDRGPEGNPEHTIRDEKPVNDIDKIDDIIKNPDRILDFGGHRYLVKTLDSGKTVAIVMHRNLKYSSGSVYELITQLAYDSISIAIDEIINEEQNGKEPTNDINC